MRKRILYLFSFLSLFQLTACGPVAELATSGLYPYGIANRIEIPAEATDGYQALKLSENGSTTAVWFFENPARRDAPVIIYFHENGENIGGLAKWNVLAKLKTLGTHVVVFDYPFYGQSTGELSQKGFVGAGNTILRWARERFSPSPIVVWGRSLGSAVAIQVALIHRENVRRLILTQPWDNLRNLIFFHYPSLAELVPNSWFRKNEYDSVKAAGQLEIPALIHHGLDDNLIPPQMGRNLADAFPSGYVTFKPIPKRSHNDIFLEASLWEDAAEFIRP